MTPYKFYLGFSIFVESFPLIPIIFGLRKWRYLSIGLRLFVGFLVSELILNGISYYYYYFIGNNLILGYLYSFFQASFLSLLYIEFSEIKLEKKIIFFLLLLSLTILVMDWILNIEKNDNYISALIINSFITLTSGYYFSKNIFSNKKDDFMDSDMKLLFSLILTFQFFIKTLDIFLEKNLLETLNNVFLWVHLRDIYSYFMLISLLIHSYLLQKIKSNE